MTTRITLSSIVIASFCLFGGLAAQAGGSRSDEGKVKIHHKHVFTIADEAGRILKDVEEQSYEVTDHAGTLSIAAAVSSTSRAFFMDQLEAVREDVNRMSRELNRLEALEPNEAAWERQAVTRAKPLLTDLLATTDSAIRFLSANPEKIHLKEYQTLTKTLYDQSSALWHSLHDSVKLADLQKKEEHVRKDLEKMD
ncbi:MAG: hypothetical protein U0R19_07850 [Bryobacteraceae bacterium]